MASPRTLSFLAISALAAASTTSPAFAEGASSEATATASTQVADRAGIQTTGEVIFKDIAVTPNVTMTPTIDSTSSSQVTVMGQGGDAVSLAVPEAIDMTKAGGEEQTLTVVTNADGSYAVPVMQGTLSSQGVLSVDVGGTMQVAADKLDPGQYRGVLVVVAQYN